MTYELDAEVVDRLEAYFEESGRGLERNAVAPRSRCTRWGSSVSTSERASSRWRPHRQTTQRARSGPTIICCTSSVSPSGKAAGSPPIRCAARRSRDGVARAHQRQGDRRHGVRGSRDAVPWRAAAVHGVRSARSPTASRPGPRSARRPGEHRRGRPAALYLPGVVDERPRPLRPGGDPLRHRIPPEWRIALEMMEHAVRRDCPRASRSRMPPMATSESSAPVFGGSTSNMRSVSMPARS